MFDLSNFNNNLEGSSIGNIIIIALISFVLSSLVGLTYEKTSQDFDRPRYFIQSLILISIPVATVMQAIGDSLARGLGMLGALAIIRFRTTLKNPRNIVFMFTSIAVGISVGVYGISIAVVGTLGFCITVFIVHYSPLQKNNYVVALLQFEITNKELLAACVKDEVNEVINSYCKKAVLINHRVKNIKQEEEKKNKNTGNSKSVTILEYRIKIDNKNKATSFVNELIKKFNLLNVTLNYKDEDNEKI